MAFEWGSISVKSGPRLFRYAFWGALALLALGALALHPTLEAVLNQDTMTRRLEAAFGTRFGGDVEFETIEIHFFFRPHAAVHRLQAVKSGRLEIECPTLQIFPALLPLLWGHLRFERVAALNPVVQLHKAPADAAGLWTGDPAGLPIAAWKELQAALPNLHVQISGGCLRIVHDGARSLRFRDMAVELDLAKNSVQLRCAGSLWDRLSMTTELDPSRMKGRGVLEVANFRPHLLTDWFLKPGGGVQLEKAEADFTLNWHLQDRDRLQVRLQGRVPDLTLRRRGRKAAFKADAFQADVLRSGSKVNTTLHQIRMADPPITLSGSSTTAAGAPFSGELILRAADADVREIRRKLLAIAPENRVVRQLFDILRGGEVPRAELAIRFDALPDALDFKNMRISGRIDQSTVFVPDVDLLLEQVSGDAEIIGQVLKGKNVAAQMGDSMVRQGSLMIGIGGKIKPMHLDLPMRADLKALPDVLRRLVQNDSLRSQLTRLESFEGAAEGRLQIDGTLKSAAVEVAADKLNCTIAHPWLPHRLQIDQGRFHYHRKKLDFDGICGRLQDVHFKSLSLGFDWRSSPMLALQSAAGEIPLNRLYTWLSARGLLETHYPLQQIDGLCAFDEAMVSGPLLDPKQWTFKLVGAIPLLNLKIDDWPGAISAQDVRFAATPQELRISQACIRFSDAALQGGIGFLKPWEGFAAFDADVTGRIGEHTNQQLLEHLDLPPALKLKSYRLETLKVHADRGGVFGAETRLQLDDGPRIFAVLQGGPNRLDVQPLEIEDEVSRARVCFTQTRDRVEAAFAGRLNHTTLDRVYSDNGVLQGWIEGDMTLRMDPSAPLESDLKGILCGENLDLKAFARLPLSLESFAVAGGEKSLHIQAAKLNLDGSPLALTGSLNFTQPAMELNLDVNAGALEFEKIKGLLRAGKNIKADGRPFFRGRVALKAESLRFGHFLWTPCNVTLRLQAAESRIDVHETAVCGIAAPGRINFSEGELDLHFDLEAQHQDLNSTLNCLLPKPVDMDGLFDFKGQVSGKGPPSSVVDALIGDFMFSAAGGNIYRFETLSKIFSLLNVTEILAGRMPDFQSQGLPYDNARIDAGIAHGRIAVRELVIDGPTLKIFGEGQIPLQGGDIDMTLLVAPLKTVDRLVDKVPVINKILGGTLVSIPVKVTGDLQTPKVIPLGPAAIGTRLLDIMKNTTQLPFEIIKPILPEVKSEPPAAGAQTEK